ncbi:hypothetical protein [Aestuariibacter sp. A3R04]|uniref:hypothetical protein n=1 Tax=Aestuariibacter sp. A3R04 TaxID=2841571 RepID=UPI001C08B9A9|nr:hypothetical protein [Aestuariibacter sp. A3R04]MBU3022869.1 hypothetical protein [Aestuariibacter sp. A3R04]
MSNKTAQLSAMADEITRLTLETAKINGLQMGKIKENLTRLAALQCKFNHLMVELIKDE